MNSNRIPHTEAFAAATRVLLREQGRGAQVRLAQALGVSKQYVSDLIAERRRIPDGLKDEIADYFDKSFVEMILIGDGYIREGVFFPHSSQVEGLPANSPERALQICILAGNDEGLDAGRLLRDPDALHHTGIDGVDEYLAGDLSDAALYKEARRMFSDILLQVNS